MTETKRDSKGSESPEDTLNYADIEDQLPVAGILFKYHNIGPGATERAVRELGLDSHIEQKLLKGPYGSRDGYHLIRLLKNGGVEKTFAIAYIEHADSAILQDRHQARAILDVINSEGTDTTLFWTFAPYLFQALTEKGIAANKAIAMVLNWAKDGVSVIDGMRSGRNWHEVHLKGLEFLNRHHKSQYVLTRDANHPSHKFTAQEAKRIADMLIAENVRYIG